MKFAFVFPGQGSQSVGMLDSWVENKAAMDVVSQANAALGEDLGALISTGPLDQLNLTTYTQPAMLTASLAMLAAWRAAGGPEPSVMAGHSLGEYSALSAAGALQLPDAVRVVRIRADAMQAAVAVGSGAMAAILGLEDDAVMAACMQAAQDEVVEAVNFNAPAQVVIAGHKQAVERAMENAKAAGAKRAVLLPVSAPFHSSLLKPAAAVLSEALGRLQIHVPTIPVIHNVDVQIHEDPALIRQALVDQAWHPVRWVQTIEAMASMGVTHVIECGPGKVLTGLVKRIVPEMTGMAVNDPASMKVALETLSQAQGTS
jgi:[acyl-carrier-protein] S-malonyltransferase